MAKGIFAGVSGTLRKVKKVYIGAGGIPHKVKKVYVGIGGVPRLTYSSEVSYYSGSSNVGLLSYTQAMVAGGSSSYVLFAKDQSMSGQAAWPLDFYDSSLVKGTGITLSNDRIVTKSSGTSYPNKAAFCNYSNNLWYNCVDWFDTSLVKISRSWSKSDWDNETPGKIACNSGGTSVCSNYNSKGFDNNYLEWSSIMWQAGSIMPLSTPEYAWFPCGYWGGSNTSEIGLLNSYGVQSRIHASQPLSDYGIAKAGNYVLIAGGYYRYNDSNKGYTNVVDVFDTNLVRTNASVLSLSRSSLLGLTVESSAVFVGGLYSNPTISSSNVDIYDENLLRTTTSIPKARGSLVGATAGNYGIAGGGAIYDISLEDTRKLDIFEG
jgi:hypothetical protein